MTTIHLNPAPPAGSLVTVTYGGPTQPAPPVPAWLAPDGRPWQGQRNRPPLTVAGADVAAVPHAAWLSTLPPVRFRSLPPVYRTLVVPRWALLP